MSEETSVDPDELPPTGNEDYEDHEDGIPDDPNAEHGANTEGEKLEAQDETPSGGE